MTSTPTKQWVLLLRGINVGGRKIVPMIELRALLKELGLANVRTYIQSGNGVFESDLDAAALTENIETAMEAKFGFRPKAMVIAADDFMAAIENCPYPMGNEDSKTLHFFFLSAKSQSPDLEAITELAKESEAFTLTDKAFYLQAPEGIGRSKLASNAEKKLGVATTARNLRTIMKIADMVAGNKARRSAPIA
ncbi:MAG: DUF1697 domain-containing protein [Robiginitomaculum sp.]